MRSLCPCLGATKHDLLDNTTVVQYLREASEAEQAGQCFCHRRRNHLNGAICFVLDGERPLLGLSAIFASDGGPSLNVLNNANDIDDVVGRCSLQLLQLLELHQIIYRLAETAAYKLILGIGLKLDMGIMCIRMIMTLGR